MSLPLGLTRTACEETAEWGQCITKQGETSNLPPPPELNLCHGFGQEPGTRRQLKLLILWLCMSVAHCIHWFPSCPRTKPSLEKRKGVWAVKWQIWHGRSWLRYKARRDSVWKIDVSYISRLERSRVCVVCFFAGFLFRSWSLHCTSICNSTFTILYKIHMIRYFFKVSYDATLCLPVFLVC